MYKLKLLAVVISCFFGCNGIIQTLLAQPHKITTSSIFVQATLEFIPFPSTKDSSDYVPSRLVGLSELLEWQYEIPYFLKWIDEFITENKSILTYEDKLSLFEQRQIFTKFDAQLKQPGTFESKWDLYKQYVQINKRWGHLNLIGVSDKEHEKIIGLHNSVYEGLANNQRLTVISKWVHDFIFLTTDNNLRFQMLPNMKFNNDDEKLMFIAGVMDLIPYNENMKNGIVSQNNNRHYGDLFNAAHSNDPSQSHVCTGFAMTAAKLSQDLGLKGIIRTMDYHTKNAFIGHAKLYIITPNNIYIDDSGALYRADNNQLVYQLDPSKALFEIPGLVLNFQDVTIDATGKFHTKSVGMSFSALGDYLNSLGIQYGFQNPNQELFAIRNNIQIMNGGNSYGLFFGHLHNGSNINGWFYKRAYSSSDEAYVVNFRRVSNGVTQNGLYFAINNSIFVTKDTGPYYVYAQLGVQMAGMVSDKDHVIPKPEKYSIVNLNFDESFYYDHHIIGFGKAGLSYYPNNSIVNGVKIEGGMEMVQAAPWVFENKQFYHLVLNRWMAQGTFDFNIGQNKLIFVPKYYYFTPLKEQIVSTELSISGKKYNANIKAFYNLYNNVVYIRTEAGVNFSCHYMKIPDAFLNLRYDIRPGDSHMGLHLKCAIH